MGRRHKEHGYAGNTAEKEISARLLLSPIEIPMKKKVVVIGAGFGGLSIAALLAQDGYDVTVVEKNDQSGGRGMMFSDGEFRFDMGPSWYLMPEVFERFFALFDKKPEDYYRLQRLDPSYRIFFGPQDWVDIVADLEKNLETFEQMETGAAQTLKKYLEKSKYQYEVSMQEFLYKDYTSILDFFNKRMLIEGSRLNVFENLDKYLKRNFKNERLRKILAYSMVFLGGAPNNTPAIYSLMSHIDFNLGVWYPLGGMNAVARGIERLGTELGVEFVYNQEVKKILVNSQGRATGILTKTGELAADLVIGNADYHHIETVLLDPEYQSYTEAYWKKRTIAPSAFILYVGLTKRLKGLIHHNLSFEYDWMKHFDDIFKNPVWSENPSYYICAPAKTEPGMAPPGGENLFILVPLAAGLRDTDEVRERYTEKILRHLEVLLGESIIDAIAVKHIFSQRDFFTTFNAYKGTALGLSHTLFQTAFFRPRHRSKKVKNLYFTGQYTHPGIGVPICLISSQIVRDLITNQSR